MQEGKQNIEKQLVERQYVLSLVKTSSFYQENLIHTTASMAFYFPLGFKGQSQFLIFTINLISFLSTHFHL